MLGIVGAEAWRAGRYGRLVGRMYPGADRERSRVIGQAVLWLFLYDDYLAPADPATEQRRSRLMADLVAQTLDGALRERPMAPVGPLWDLRGDLVAAVGPQWWQRCASDVRDFAEAIHREACSRSRLQPPAPDEYLELRRGTSGWALLTDLVELAAGTQLSPGVVAQPVYGDLRWAAGDVACAINDLLSLEKELRAGEFHNLVLVIQQARGCDREKARQHVRDLITERLEDYRQLRARFLTVLESRRFDDAERRAAHDYVRGLEHLMRGSLDWSRESGRYEDSPTRSEQR